MWLRWKQCKHLTLLTLSIDFNSFVTISSWLKNKFFSGWFWFIQGTGGLDSLTMTDLRVGTVLLFIPMLIPGRHGTMETARTIYITGYVRWSQARHESQLEITITGQIISIYAKCMWPCLRFKLLQWNYYRHLCAMLVHSSFPAADNVFSPCYVLAENTYSSCENAINLYNTSRTIQPKKHWSLHISVNLLIPLKICNRNWITNLIKHNVSSCIWKKMSAM